MISIYKRILRYFKPHTLEIVLAVFFVIIVAIASAAAAWLVKPLLDDIFIDPVDRGGEYKNGKVFRKCYI